MKKIIYFIALLILHLSFISETKAQNGNWVSQPIPPLGTFTKKMACGDDWALFSMQYNTNIYSFNTRTSSWNIIDLGPNNYAVALDAKGQVAFAYSDSVIIGFSSGLAQWDIVHFEGAPLNFNRIFSSPIPYGCSNNFVIFLTTDWMYVFDVSIGTWQQYDYNLPPDYDPYISLIYLSDEFVLLQIYRNTGQPQQTVYNFLTHSFNQLDYGVYLSHSSHILDHGFAGTYAFNPDVYQITGYSVYTNQFSTLQISGEGMENEYGVFSFDPEKIGDITTYAICFVLYVGSNKIIHFYGYDTKIGTWNDETLYLGPEYNLGSGMLGGQFAVNFWTDQGSLINYVTYSGVTGLYLDFNAGLIYNSMYYFRGYGGKVFCETDQTHLYGYSFSQQLGRLFEFNDIIDLYGWPDAGENFCTANLAALNSDTMFVFFYNGESNDWIFVPTWKSTAPYSISKNIYALSTANPANTESKLIFYSPFLNTITAQDIQTSYVTTYAKNFLAYGASQNLSYFFDARTGNANEFNFYFAPLITDSVAFGRNPSGNSYYGYSALSSQWINHEVLEYVPGFDLKGFIGLAYSANKVYTYNGLHNSWIELTPQGGEYKDYCLGTKTALMVRNQMLYAFDPQAITGIENTYPIAFKNFDLKQNYPNPFNPSTKISWQLPTSSDVTLKIFNTLGEEITTLVNKEYQDVGVHSSLFIVNSSLPSGVYFYKLKAGEFISTKKMILIK